MVTFCGVQPWYLGSSCPRAGAQWSCALPHSGCGKLVQLQLWAEKVQLFFARGGSRYSIWCCLTPGLLLSPLSVATGASKSWLLLLPSSKKPQRQKSHLMDVYNVHAAYFALGNVGHSPVVLSGYCYSVSFPQCLCLLYRRFTHLTESIVIPSPM